MSQEVTLEDLVELFGVEPDLQPESWYEGAAFQIERAGESLLIDLRPNSNYILCRWCRDSSVLVDIVFIGYESLAVERHKGQEHLFVRLPAGSYLVIQVAPEFKVSVRGQLLAP